MVQVSSVSSSPKKIGELNHVSQCKQRISRVFVFDILASIFLVV